MLLSAIFALAACAPVSPGGTNDDGGVGQGPAYEGQPYASAVVSFTPGEGAGHGEEKLPDVVLGPPKGAGVSAGNSTDVLSLGRGGSIVLELGLDVVDGDGVDLLVFENAFFAFGDSGVFADPGVVSLSLDGDEWSTFPCDSDAEAPNGCAGYAPVLPAEEGGALQDLGGDAFDLADVGLERARYVRIVDADTRLFGDDGTAGFDLDALGVVNAAER